MLVLLIVLISLMIFSLRLALSGAELVSKVANSEIRRYDTIKNEGVLSSAVKTGFSITRVGLRMLIFVLKVVRACLMFFSIGYMALYLVFFSIISLGAAGAYTLFFEDLASYTEVSDSSNISSSSGIAFGGVDTLDFSTINNKDQAELLKEIAGLWGSDVTQERVDLIMKGATRIGRSSYSQSGSRGGSSDDQSVFDCSSFVGWTFNKSIDKDIPTDTSTASYLSGDVGAKFERVSADKLIPGDVVLNEDTLATGNSNHIGIYVGKNSKGQKMYIHCTSSGIGGVQITVHDWKVFLRYKGWK